MLERESGARKARTCPEPVVRPTRREGPPRSPTGASCSAASTWKRTLMIWAPVDPRLRRQQRPGHLAAHALPPGVQAAPEHQPDLRLDHLGRRRRRLHPVRALHRQGRPQALVHHRVPARHGCRWSSSRRSAPPRPTPVVHPRRRSPTRSCRPSPSRSTSTPPSSTPPASAGERHGVRQRVAAGRVVHRPRPRRLHRRGRRDPVSCSWPSR